MGPAVCLTVRLIAIWRCCQRSRECIGAIIFEELEGPLISSGCCRLMSVFRTRESTERLGISGSQVSRCGEGVDASSVVCLSGLHRGR